MRGQLEQGENTGYLHWQLVIHTTKPSRLSWIKKTFGEGMHGEPTRSEDAEEYVWKEETRVAGTRFELGKKSLKRNCAADWDEIYALAKSGDFSNIPKDVLIRCYNQFKSIAKDNMKPEAGLKKVIVYWGPTGTGKSHAAWEEAGLDAFPKDPATKFWDGYQGHSNVVIEEFRGEINISHMLRWLDKYPVCVEAKHGACVLKAKNIWITSNLHPSSWYPSLDGVTVNALLRRLDIREKNQVYIEPQQPTTPEQAEQ